MWAKVRSTSLMSASFRLMLIGSPTYCFSVPPTVVTPKRWRPPGSPGDAPWSVMPTASVGCDGGGSCAAGSAAAAGAGS